MHLANELGLWGSLPGWLEAFKQHSIRLRGHRGCWERSQAITVQRRGASQLQDPSVPSACEVNSEVRFVETHRRLLLRTGTAMGLLLLMTLEQRA